MSRKAVNILTKISDWKILVITFKYHELSHENWLCKQNCRFLSRQDEPIVTIVIISNMVIIIIIIATIIIIIITIIAITVLLLFFHIRIIIIMTCLISAFKNPNALTKATIIIIIITIIISK